MSSTERKEQLLNSDNQAESVVSIKHSWKRQSKVFLHFLTETLRIVRSLFCCTGSCVVPHVNWKCQRKKTSYHLSLLYLHIPPSHRSLHICFPAGFVFTRSAATVSLSFLSPLSTSILSKPLAGAFNRRWHLSPRAVMFLIHQKGMTACIPPPLRFQWPNQAGRVHTRPVHSTWKAFVRQKLTLMVTGSGLLIMEAWSVCLISASSPFLGWIGDIGRRVEDIQGCLSEQ